MIDFDLAITIHVLSVVVWIGGVAMVTTVILPAVARQLLTIAHAILRRGQPWTAPGAVIVSGPTG